MEKFKILGFSILLLIICSTCTGLEGGLEIKKREKYITIEKDANRGNSEIYTSMLELENFFKEELEFVEDLRALYDKKLISVEAKQNIGSYIQSFDDVVGDQDEEAHIMHNPLNAYNLIRHVAVGWGVVESTLEDEVKRKRNNVGKRVNKVLNRRTKFHVPDQPDVDGIASGIVRLHDYYRQSGSQDFSD